MGPSRCSPSASLPRSPVPRTAPAQAGSLDLQSSRVREPLRYTHSSDGDAPRARLSLQDYSSSELQPQTCLVMARSPSHHASGALPSQRLTAGLWPPWIPKPVCVPAGVSSWRLSRCGPEPSNTELPSLPLCFPGLFLSRESISFDAAAFAVFSVLSCLS